MCLTPGAQQRSNPVIGENPIESAARFAKCRCANVVHSDGGLRNAAGSGPRRARDMPPYSRPPTFPPHPDRKAATIPEGPAQTRHRIFDLVVCSAFDCGLASYGQPGQADVTIGVGEPTANLAPGNCAGACVRVSKTTTHFSIPRLGQVVASTGLEITVQPDPGTPADKLAPFLRTAGMGAILHQRGAVTLHASVVSINDRAVAFSGCSGAGKSVIAAALQVRNFPLLSDEICCLRDPDRLYISPASPEIWVWPDAARSTAISHVDAPRVRSDLPLKRIEARYFLNETVPLTRIYFLQPRDADEEVSIEALTPVDGTALFLDNLYQPGLYAQPIRRAVATCAMHCGEALPCRLLKVPRSLDRLANLLDLVERDAGE